MSCDGACRVEKEKGSDNMDEDVLAATSSSDAKLKPRLTMIEQQVGSCVAALFWQCCFTVLRVHCVACLLCCVCRVCWPCNKRRTRPSATCCASSRCRTSMSLWCHRHLQARPRAESLRERNRRKGSFCGCRFRTTWHSRGAQPFHRAFHFSGCWPTHVQKSCSIDK